MSSLIPATSSAPTEAKALAKQLAKARNELIASFEQHFGCSREDAVTKAAQYDTAEYAAQILSQPLSATTWHDLDQLAEVDPDAAATRWQDMVDEARQDWDSGHRSAEALEGGGTTCQSRAEYIALRHQFAENWQVRTGIEMALIDAMTEAYSLKLFWIKRMLALDALETSSGYDDKMRPPSVSAFQAIDQAAAMVDRFDRMFMRAVRQLRDLKRFNVTVVVNQPNQVNVGQQQVNTNDGSPGSR